MNQGTDKTAAGPKQPAEAPADGKKGRAGARNLDTWMATHFQFRSEHAYTSFKVFCANNKKRFGTDYEKALRVWTGQED